MKLMQEKILLMISILTAMLIFAGCGKEEVDLKNFIKVTYEGANGYGMAYVKLDKDDLCDYIYNLKEYENDQEKMAAMAQIYAFRDTLKCTSVNTDQLSNGDKVKITIAYNVSAIEDYNVEFINSSIEETVSGLKEVEVIDAFANLEVSCSGISPKIQLSINNNGTNEYDQYLRFWIEGDNNSFKKGDTVDIKVAFKDNYPAYLGYIIEEDTMNYVIQDVPYYIPKVWFCQYT